MKKIISLLMTMIIQCSLSLGCSPQPPYTLVDGHLTIHYGITSIEDKQFMDKGLISVTIPNSVTTIGNSAFANNQLTSITIPNSVTTIGDDAFYDNLLTSVTIPNSVTYIGGNAFAANQLTSVTIPNSITYIGGNAFAQNQLTSITIPGSVTFRGTTAFRDNPITSVILSDDLDSFNLELLWGINLTSITLGPNVNFTGGAPSTSLRIFLQNYQANNRRAGTYSISFSYGDWDIWTFQPR